MPTTDDYNAEMAAQAAKEKAAWADEQAYLRNIQDPAVQAQRLAAQQAAAKGQIDKAQAAMAPTLSPETGKEVSGNSWAQYLSGLDKNEWNKRRQQQQTWVENPGQYQIDQSVMAKASDQAARENSQRAMGNNGLTASASTTPTPGEDPWRVGGGTKPKKPAKPAVQSWK